MYLIPINIDIITINHLLVLCIYYTIYMLLDLNESQVMPYVLYWGDECDAFRKYVAQNTGNNNSDNTSASANSSKFDVMIAADVIYEQEQIVPLLCTVKEFLKGSIILYQYIIFFKI